MEKLYRLLYPMRACLITSRHEGKDNIMAASWVFPMSMDPPIFGVSVAEKRHSFGLIRKGKAFGINLPHPELRDATVVCGTKSGRDVDKFKEAGITREEAKHVPLIKECPASIECEVVDEIAIGDHVIFVGKATKTVKRFEGKGLYHLGGRDFVSI
jgi:flavin reductase (DIM6/NTAB) family NADH-FMN oxidoreductase RutF